MTPLTENEAAEKYRPASTPLYAPCGLRHLLGALVLADGFSASRRFDFFGGRPAIVFLTFLTIFFFLVVNSAIRRVM